MNWNDFAKEVHQVAVDHGLWDKPVSFDDVICMCICELAEAVEEWRDGKPNLYCPCNAGGLCEDDKTEGAMDCGNRVIDPDHPEIRCKAKSKEPHGVAVELADCVLRLLDYLAYQDMDIARQLGMVPAPDTLPGLVCRCVGYLARAHHEHEIPKHNSLYWSLSEMCQCLNVIRDWFLCEDIDLEAILRAKHEYNKTRPFRHGGTQL